MGREQWDRGLSTQRIEIDKIQARGENIRISSMRGTIFALAQMENILVLFFQKILQQTFQKVRKASFCLQCFMLRDITPI